MIILVLVTMFGFQNYQNDKMFDRYENFISSSQSNQSAEKSDTVDVKLSELSDSITQITKSLLEVSKRDTNIVKKSYIKNIYIMSDSVDNTEYSDIKNKTVELITKSD